MSFIPIYILILFFTIIIDYIAGIIIENASGKKRKLFLLLSLISNLSILGFFKYFNFFNSSVSALLSFLGFSNPIPELDIILPIGLSFHTFQAMSYTIEVYFGRQKAERHFGIYSLYVMFYPQLVAGPIERPQNLLHQFYEKHNFDYQRVTDGLKLITWGFFKKLVIADRLALFVNQIYTQPILHDGTSLTVATVFFAYQIYCDFSGYSDIALGAAQVMGFKLMLNFDRPYASKSISEFWRRWHISLSTWFRDYVYIPLGGSRVPVWKIYRNLFITFFLSGLWHGASWTFVLWGALNGVYLIVGAATKPWRKTFVNYIVLDKCPALHKTLQVIITFGLTCFAWIFFRAESIADAFLIIKRIFCGPWGGVESIFCGRSKIDFLIAITAIITLEAIQLWSSRDNLISRVNAQPVYIRWILYYLLVLSIILFGMLGASKFIYFQF
jgi:D-alanyl-lipoteichoic acid acyltransferase DltB (MBOAT superfamily)